MDCGFRIADYGLRIADYGLRIPDFGLWIMDSGFQVVGSGFRIPGCGFQRDIEPYLQMTWDCLIWNMRFAILFVHTLDPCEDPHSK